MLLPVVSSGTLPSKYIWDKKVQEPISNSVMQLIVYLSYFHNHVLWHLLWGRAAELKLWASRRSCSGSNLRARCAEQANVTMACDILTVAHSIFIIIIIYNIASRHFPCGVSRDTLSSGTLDYPLYARRFMLNVWIGGAQPIDVLRALTHLILTCGFPHDVVLHRMSSRYLLYISFLKNSLVHGLRGFETSRNPRPAVRTPGHRHSHSIFIHNIRAFVLTVRNYKYMLIRIVKEHDVNDN